MAITEMSPPQMKNDLRTEVVGFIRAHQILCPRIGDRIHSSLIVVNGFHDDYVRKQSVAWKE